MGVVNITPDSFSDGGLYNSEKLYLERVKELISYKCDVIDIGAESTAPMNSPISFDEELGRIDNIVLPHLDLLDKFSEVSIDTYQVETIRFLLEKTNFSKIYSKGKLIWNDISGQADFACLELLKDFPNLRYVYSHNEVELRSQSVDHLSFTKESYSKEYYDQYFAAFCGEKIIQDPCFGFSKTRDQNYELLSFLPDLVNKSESEWLVGISRKSFLRFLEAENKNLILQTEVSQALLLQNFISNLNFEKEKTIYLRIHEGAVFVSLDKYFSYLLPRN